MINNLEIFNEGMILIINYHMFLYHFFDEDPLSSYYVGWSCIGITSLMMVVNVFIMIGFTIRNFRAAVIKVLYRLRLRSRMRILRMQATKKGLR